MSTNATTWVWKSAQAKGNDRLVLLAIADEANSHGEDAFPGIELLAYKTKLHRATVLRCIVRLEKAGELQVIRPVRRGIGHFNRYIVPCEGYPQESQSATLKESHSSRKSTENQVAPVRPNPTTTRRDPRGSRTKDETETTQAAQDEKMRRNAERCSECGGPGQVETPDGCVPCPSCNSEAA